METYRSSQSHRGQGNSGRSEQKTGIEHILDYTNLCSFGNTFAVYLNLNVAVRRVQRD